jgi:hypothetical protein
MQLGSIDRTTRGAENPERLRSADHTTRHIGGLDWDFNTHRSTQQLIVRIGASTRSTHSTSKDRSSQNGTSIRVSTTPFRRRHEPPQIARNQNISSPPLKGETTNWPIFFGFHKDQKKRRKNSTGRKRPHRAATAGPRQSRGKRLRCPRSPSRRV